MIFASQFSFSLRQTDDVPGFVPNKGQGVPAALQHFILILFVTHLLETLCYLQSEYSLRNIVNYIMLPLIV